VTFDPGGFSSSRRLLPNFWTSQARWRLEAERANVSAVALLCGLRTYVTMRRASLRHVGVPPGGSRDLFRERHPTINHVLEGRLSA
jgi:transcriptional regulator GlxA family with amidase domain